MIWNFAIDESALLQHLRTFATGPPLPSTGACCHRCRVWKQLWLCRGWVPATVSRDAMLNIQAFFFSAPAVSDLQPSHLPHICSAGGADLFIAQINTAFAVTPPLLTLQPAPNICTHTHKPSLTSLSAYDPRLQGSRPFSSFCPQCQSFAPLHPGPSTDFILLFLPLFFLSRSIRWWRAFRPGTKFCYALTHIDSQSECITELWPEFPTSTTAWVHPIGWASITHKAVTLKIWTDVIHHLISWHTNTHTSSHSWSRNKFIWLQTCCLLINVLRNVNIRQLDIFTQNA